jgi:hypothetical protein
MLIEFVGIDPHALYNLVAAHLDVGLVYFGLRMHVLVRLEVL